MKPGYILSLLCLLLAGALHAAPITRTRAAETARAFIGGRPSLMLSSRQLSLASPDQGIRPYYVFNIGAADGFVIVSGDDAACPVLGYSDSGHFDEENIPDNMRAWLEGYAREISRMQKLNLPAHKVSASASGRHDVAPLLTARWNQNRPYNSLCPPSNSGRGHRPTGCVATAMAQVMYYHKWPQAATAGIPAYTYKDEAVWGGDGSQKSGEALPPAVFDWDSMLDSYDEETMYDDKSARAVAELMQYVGHSVKMAYGVKASGAFSQDIPLALVRSFGYRNTARLILRSEYPSQEAWNEAIYREVSSCRPVIYSGITVFGSGHQFVCDGYEDGFFHINWGWSGMSNGFFKLDVLDPDNQGIGGAGSGSSFSEMQTAVIGVQKNYEEDMVHAEDLLAEAGGQTSAGILFHDTYGSYTSLQFDVRLPEGISLVQDAGGTFAATLNQQRPQSADHCISVSRLSGSSYRFVIYSPTNSVLSGSPLLDISLDISADVEKGSYAAEISNVTACATTLRTKHLRGCKFSICVVAEKNLAGDADNNGVVDGSDVDATMQYIGGVVPPSFISQLADTYADGTIDIADAALTNDIILQQSGADRHIVSTSADSTDVIVPVPASSGISLELKNTSCYKALQADIHLPEGIMLTGFVDGSTRISGFDVRCSCISDGVYRLALYAPDGRNIDLNEGSLVHLATNQPAAGVTLRHVVALTSDLRRVSLSDVFYKVPAGIDSVRVGKTSPGRIYTLGGVRLDKPLGELPRGIYIIDGKKTMVI